MSVISYMSPSRVMNIYKDNSVDTPNISFTVISSVATGTSGTKIVDTSVDFIAAGVQTGDIVYDYTSRRVDTVSEVVSRTELESTFGWVISGDTYKIFSAANAGGGILQVDDFTTSGLQQIMTIGGDIVQVAIEEWGQIVPIRTKRVYRTTGTTASCSFVMIWD